MDDANMDDDEDPGDNIDVNLGLFDLFSIQHYVKETIEIPCYGFCSQQKESSVTPTALQIELWHSVAATTDPDGTGHVLWPVSRLLSHYLASDQIHLPGKTVLELGAGGTALPSITAALCGASRVVATDGNDDAVLELLRRNIHHQQERLVPSSALVNDDTPDSSTCLSCQQLQWGRRRPLQQLLQEFGPFDVIVAADVVQWPAVLEPLLHTISALLWRDPLSGPSHAYSPVLLLGIVERSTAVHQQFLALAEGMDLVCRNIDAQEYLSNHGCLPLSCQERGGRVAQLLELKLRPGRSSENVPFLLRPNLADDCIVGASFEHTLFLPC